MHISIEDGFTLYSGPKYCSGNKKIFSYAKTIGWFFYATLGRPFHTFDYFLEKPKKLHQRCYRSGMRATIRVDSFVNEINVVLGMFLNAVEPVRENGPCSGRQQRDRGPLKCEIVAINILIAIVSIVRFVGNEKICSS
jgi:hypothetical protein